MRRNLQPALLGLCLTLGAACSTAKPAVKATPSVDAETTLRQGDEQLKNKNYVEAEKLYEAVRSKYPFLDASKTAELRLADTDYDRELFLEARDRYQTFAKLHPTHPRVDYAAFRVALSHYREVPSDFFMLPPSHEKDQTEVRAALKSASEFLKQYPSSSFVPEAQKIVSDTQRRLAEHDLSIADFYSRRSRWKAVVLRLEGLWERYPSAGVEERALFKLHNAYTGLKDVPKARQSLERVIQSMPNTPAAQKAQKLLGG